MAVAKLGGFRSKSIRVRGHKVVTYALGSGDETVLRMHRALPRVTVKTFKNSSHTRFYKEPEKYFPALVGFLKAQAGRSRGKTAR